MVHRRIHGETRIPASSVRDTHSAQLRLMSAVVSADHVVELARLEVSYDQSWVLSLSGLPAAGFRN